VQAACHGVSIDKASIYVTHQPCSICTKILINSGINHFLFSSPYNDTMAEELFTEAKIKITILGNK
jgi:dCMP deaminase